MVPTFSQDKVVACLMNGEIFTDSFVTQPDGERNRKYGQYLAK